MRPNHEALLAELHRHRTADERLLWHGRPHPRRTGIETLALLGSLWAIGVSLLLLQGDAAEPGFGIGELIAMGLVIAGLWFSARQIQNWLNLYRTVYGITDRRLLIVRASWNAKTTSVPHAHHRRVTRKRGFSGKSSLKVVIGTAKPGDGESGPQLDYIDLRDILDGETAFALLTR